MNLPLANSQLYPVVSMLVPQEAGESKEEGINPGELEKELEKDLQGENYEEPANV